MASCYDAVFDIEYIGDIFNGQGWEFILPSICEEKKVKLAEIISNASKKEGKLDGKEVDQISKIIFPKKSLIACAVGLFDRGKTFVINSISEGNFDSGVIHHTKGISATSVKNGLAKDTLLVDSKGTNTPLEKASIDKMEKILPKFVPQGKDPAEKGISTADRRIRKKIYDEEYNKHFNYIKSKAIVNKKLTEYYLQSVIFGISDIIIIVVNELNWIDQQYIDSVCKLQNDRRENTLVIVIHNFKTIETLDHFKLMREQYVESINNGELKEEIVDQSTKTNAFVYKLKGDNNNNNNNTLLHLFLCKSGSEAGNAVNEGTFKKIQQIFTSRTVEKRESFISHLINVANSSLLKVVKDPGELNLYVNEDGKFFLHSTQKNPKFLQDEVEVSNECLLSLRSSDFIPSIDRIIYTSTNDGFWIIGDFPGFTLADLSIKKNKISRNIIISGEKHLKFPKYSTETKKLSTKNFVRYDGKGLQYENAKTQIFRQFGQFSISIHIPNDFDFDSSTEKMANGELVIWFPPLIEEQDNPASDI